MSFWNLLPAALVSRAKAVAALLGGIAEVVVSFFPSVALNHWAAVVIAVLTALGVYTVPNSNIKTIRAKMRVTQPSGMPSVADRSPTPPDGLFKRPAEFSQLHYGTQTYNPVTFTYFRGELR
jgi:hypothetical protein